MNRFESNAIHVSSMLIWIVLLGYSYPAMSQNNPVCNLDDRHEFAIGDGWIDVTQGRDEDSHHVKLKVWGPTRVGVFCESLDTEPEDEIMVVSRTTGSGSYYRLQIIDFVDDGITTRTYWSDGAPEIKQREISLGSLTPEQRKIPMHPPTLTRYVYLPQHGLLDRDQEHEWIQFIDIGVDGSNRIRGATFHSVESCEMSGAGIVGRSEKTNVKLSVECLSNVDIQRMLERVI